MHSDLQLEACFHLQLEACFHGGHAEAERICNLPSKWGARSNKYTVSRQAPEGWKLSSAFLGTLLGSVDSLESSWKFSKGGIGIGVWPYAYRA